MHFERPRLADALRGIGRTLMVLAFIAAALSLSVLTYYGLYLLYRAIVHPHLA